MKNRIAIRGSGESGTGAALLAQHAGYDVFVSDKGGIKDQYKRELDAHGIAWEENRHSLDQILNAAEIINAMVDNKQQDLYTHFAMGQLDQPVDLGPGCVAVVGARPAVGKTTFVINGLMNMAIAGHKSLFISLEMSDKQLIAKISSALTGIDSERITRNEIDDDEFWREFRRRCKAVNPDAYIVAELWKAMDEGQFSVAIRAQLPRFNGKLFKQPEVLPLDRDQIDLLLEASRADWAEVEPAIFGTLLESALNPLERHDLGAHYTPRA